MGAILIGSIEGVSTYDDGAADFTNRIGLLAFIGECKGEAMPQETPEEWEWRRINTNAGHEAFKDFEQLDTPEGVKFSFQWRFLRGSKMAEPARLMNMSGP